MENRPGFVDEERLIATHGRSTLSENSRMFRLTFIHCDDVYMIEIPKNSQATNITHWPNFFENAVHGEMFKYPFVSTAAHIPHEQITELPEEVLRAIAEASVPPFPITKNKASFIVEGIPGLKETIDARNAAKVIPFPQAI